MNRFSLWKQWGEIPERVRFVIVGLFGVAIGWLIYNLIYILIPESDNRATISWGIAYFLAILRQHALHYMLTFKESDAGYLESLIGAFLVYGIGFFITTYVNSQLNTAIGLYHQYSYFLTVAIGVVYNYIFLKRLAFRKKDSSLD